MLNFVIGRACTGKSNYIVKKAAESSLFTETIIIVPEQFTFETERAVLHTEKFNHDNISVLSFTKLYSEVSKITGFGNLPVMSDGERLLLTNMALKETAQSLNVFERYATYPDFAIKMADMIRDFKFAAVTPEEIKQAALRIGGSSGAKLSDISMVMAVYDNLISNKFIDPSDYLTRLSNLLDTTLFFEGKTVFVDSFSGFTGQQMQIIEKIIRQSDNVTFSFCTDNIDNTELGVFYNINKTAQKIKSIAKDSNAEIGDTILLEKNFYSNSSMQNLEGSFFSAEVGQVSADAVRIVSCEESSEEAFTATNIIKSLVQDKGYRYRDFIIVARNPDDYKNYIEIFSKKNNIQCFFDHEVCLTDTLFYVYLYSLMQLKVSFSTENILNFLKCGLNDYSEDDICTLEDYIYVWNIEGKDWAREWEMNPSGLIIGEISQQDRETLETLNKLRQNIYNSLSDFCNSFNGSAEERAKTVYKYIVANNVDKKLSVICERLETENSFSASVLKQSWDSIMNILDSIGRIYDEDIDTKSFINAFKISSGAVKISNVPQMLDEVTFGGADRIRHSKPKVSIILGANNGVFPKAKSSKGLLGVNDKHRLEEYGISLNDDEIKSAVEENYLVYSMLCCPTDKTFVLYSRNSSEGTGLEPSAFVSELINKLSGIGINKYIPMQDDLFVPRTFDSSVYLMSEVYGERFETLRQSFLADESTKHKVSHFEIDKFAESFNIKTENSDKLFNNDIYISATKFDNFHTCRLMYFLKYGLKTGKIRPADLNVMQRGTITHYVLEQLINTYHKDFCQLSETQISKEIDALIDEYIDLVVGSEMLKTPRFKFLLSRISKSVKEVAYHLASEFRQSGFEPAYCELEISKDGDVPELRIPIEKGNMVLTGKIDRLDTFNNRIRIVDYKTGSKSFELSDTLFGLNMQMLIYLYAVIKNGESIVESPSPAGILYMPAKSKFQNESMAMNGLILDDESVIEAMEKENEGNFIPKYKNGSTSFVDEEMFSLIFNNIENLIKSMGETVRRGDFKPEPVDSVKGDACKYCDYSSVCRKSKTKHRRVEKLSNAEIKEKLKGGECDEI